MNLTSNLTNASLNTVDLINDINGQLVREHTVVIVYIVLFSVLGLIGNPMVCYFYGVKRRLKTTSIFIIVLAVYDIVSCVVAIPFQLTDILLYITYRNNAICKLFNFINYVAACGSIFTLVTIAFDRYKTICRSTGDGISKQTAILCCVGSFAIALIVSLPIIFVYTCVQVNVPNNYGIKLVGWDCLTTNDKRYQKYVVAYLGLQLLLLFAFFTLLLALYGIIVRKIFNHKKAMQKYNDSKKTCFAKHHIEERTVTEESSISKANITLETLPIKKNDLDSLSSFGVIENVCERQPATKMKKTSSRVHINLSHETLNGSNENTSSYIDQDLMKLQKAKTDEEISAIKPGENKECRGDKNIKNSLGLIDQTNESNPKASCKLNLRRISNDNIQVTVIMLVVTIVFICSFLPYLSVAIWSSLKGLNDVEFLKGNDLVACKLARKSYLINCSLNPWIYGIFNSHFREYFFLRHYRNLLGR